MRKYLFIIFALATIISTVPLVARAVTVGPVRLEYSVNPGDLVNGEMMVQNEGQETATYYPSFEKFTEDNGQKVFSKETSDLAVWMNTANSVTLKAGEQKTISFTISVPKDASPGGHYAVIWWGTAPANQDISKQVSIVTRAGILVYLRVSGDVVESAQIENLKADNGGGFFFGLPIDFSFIFHNSGNVHLKPHGQLIINNIFGGKTASFQVNDLGFNILPQSDRTFDFTWNNDFLAFGPYKVSVNLTYGDSNKLISQSSWIFVLPINLLLYALVILLVIFLGIPKGLKSYNRWIIKKASASNLKS